MADSWYYLIESSRLGPLTLDELRQRFSSGEFSPETLVWKASLPGWTPAVEIDELAEALTQAPDPPLQVPPPPEAAPSEEEFAPPPFDPPQPEGQPPVQIPQAPEGVSQVRPWIRYWARQIDLALALGVYMAIVPSLAPSLAAPSSPTFAILAVALWVVAESLLVSSTGTTVGKYLLCTDIRTSDGEVLSLQQSFQRAIHVWIRGLAMGLPIVAYLTQILGYRELTQRGITTWDQTGGFVVRHGRISPQRAMLAVSIFLLLGLWITSNVAPLMPELTQSP